MNEDDNVVEFNGITRLNLPAERILRCAQKADLESVVIVGETASGEFYFASSYASAPETAWLLQHGVYRLNQVVDEFSDDGDSE